MATHPLTAHPTNGRQLMVVRGECEKCALHDERPDYCECLQNADGDVGPRYGIGEGNRYAYADETPFIASGPVEFCGLACVIVNDK